MIFPSQFSKFKPTNAVRNMGKALGGFLPGRIEILGEQQLKQMRESCEMAADCLVMVDENLREGMTTEDINTLVHEFIVSRHAYPAPLNYDGFPKSVCTSVNECVCHGIPGKQVLKPGDIINVDVTTYFPKQNGFHGDTSVTFYIGEPSDEAKFVTEISRQSLELGLEQVKEGARIGDIGAAIQEFAESNGCSVVRDYVGHGVGREFHAEPQVPHFGKKGTLTRMKAGMIFTIEPMINLGDFECKVLEDDWTVLTADGRLSAQFEHTVLVTKEGCEVLTKRPKVLKNSESFDWVKLGRLSCPAAFEASESSKS